MIKINFVKELNEEADTLCFFINENCELSNNGMLVDKKFNGIISKSIKSFDNFNGKFSETKLLTASSKNDKIHKIYIIGIGKPEELNDSKVTLLGGHVANAIKSSRSKDISIDTTNLTSEDNPAALIALGANLGLYKFDKYQTKLKDTEKFVHEELNIFTNDIDAANESFIEQSAIQKGIYEARDVISEPGNVLYPQSYAEIIKEKLEPLGVEVEILSESEMRNLGMGALLGVGQGSSKESKLVIMKYTGADESDQPVAFVGKGVTFDTGGISLKPSRNMGDMKYDMSGSASVFGTMLTLAAREAKVNAVGVVGLVENMPGGNAQRPGDIVKTMSGQTVEVLDTDAEGRLVLADALWYTQDKFNPKFIIDLATLTGAVVIALADQYAGLFSNDDKLSKELLAAGDKSGEKLWRLPLCSEFDNMLKSDVADMANLGVPLGHASSSTAGQFLQRFVNKKPWAHLDIAGVANMNKPKPLSPKGAVGFGVRLLNKFIKENYEN